MGGRNGSGSGSINERWVVVADPHPSVRFAVEHLIERDLRLTIIAGVATAERAVSMTLQHRAGLLVVDAGMPEPGGIWAVREVRRAQPATQVIVHTGLEDPEWIRASLLAGARGVVSKALPLSDLKAALVAVRKGEVVVRWPEPTSMPGEGRGEQLSAKEEEVFHLIAHGWSNDQVAEQLCVSAKTIESHRSRLMTKLELRDRRDLVQLARRWGLLAVRQEEKPSRGQGSRITSNRSASP